MPDIAHWQEEYANSLTVIPISRGDRKANQAKAKEFGVKPILLQKDRELAQAYQCAGTLGAVVIRSDGTVGSPRRRSDQGSSGATYKTADAGVTGCQYRRASSTN
jgi:hypothetical protein